MKILSYLFALALMISSIQSKAGFINSVSTSPSSAYLCDTVTLSISASLTCLGSYFTTNTHSVSGSTITVTVGAFDPSICQGLPGPTPMTYSITGISPGSYTIIVRYNAQTTGTASTSLTILNSAVANAGEDTTVCALSTFLLNANPATTGVTASWTVIAGSATLSSPTAANALASNLSPGLNSFKWSMADANCSTSDIINVVNSPAPSPAITELNKSTCYDTATIHATAITVGTGEWSALTPGVFLINKNNPICKVVNLKIGVNEFEWTVKNGSCPTERDTLKVTYTFVTDTPVIAANATLLLTSTPAPAYQWYQNQNIIPSANSQTYQVITDGTYYVLTSETGCTNGLTSNELEFKYVGLKENIDDQFHFYPNPSREFVQLENVEPGSIVILFNTLGEEVSESKILGRSITLDISALDSGVYIFLIEGKTSTKRGHIVVNK